MRINSSSNLGTEAFLQGLEGLLKEEDSSHNWVIIKIMVIMQVEGLTYGVNKITTKILILKIIIII